MTIHLHPHNPLFSQWYSTPELAIVDSGVDHPEHLLQGLQPNTEVRLLDSNQDGVIQITQILQEVRAKRVHIVSHGSPGCLYLGNTQLNLNTLKRYQEQVKTWNVPLLLYGCRVAATETGQRFVQQLEEITRVTVKASAERVGNISFGGTWNLMWSTPWFPKVMATYPGVFDPSPSPEPTPRNFEETWKFGIFGSGIGQSGLITADIDNDGTIEILANGSNSTFGASDFWYVLEPTPEDGQYYTQWSSDLESDKITAIAAFDYDRDGIYSIFVGLGNGDIAVYDGSSLEPTAHIESPADSINHILLADADNDSDQELVFTDNDETFIYNLSSLDLENKIAYGAKEFEVGNVDGDSEQEIIFSSGQVLEFDGTETIVEWEYGGGDFGALVELSDIDSDGMKEIIGASSWYHLTAFDADIQSPKWQLNTDHDIDALLVTDIDDDGIEDILYGDGQWGSIYAYDPVTLTKTWEIDNPEHGVTDIAVTDTDGDGDLEVLWGAGASSTGSDHLYVHGIPTLAAEWSSQHIDGPFHAIDVGDVDSDGNQEIVFASFESNSGSDDGVLFVYDTQTHDLEWQSPENLFGRFAWTGIHDVKIGDVDDDGTEEIVVATDRLYDGTIYVIDGVTKEVEESYLYDDGAPIYSLDIADVDNDGDTEIIAGGGRAHTGAPGVYAYVINGATGEVEWKSISLGSYWSEISPIQVANVDGDQALEIVAVNNNIFVIDGESHQQWQTSLGGFSGLDLQDIDRDGIAEIIVGTETGNLIALDGQTREEKLNINVSSSDVLSVKVEDIDADGNPELTFTSDGRVGIYSIEEESLLWENPNLGSSVGAYNSLVVSDFDADEYAEILVGTNYTVVQFDNTLDTGENNPPVAINDSAITESNTEVLIPVLTNDNDPNGDPIQLLNFTTPDNGTVEGQGSDLIYTPDPNFTGPDSFTYSISDGNGATDTATVNITVTPAPEDALQLRVAPSEPTKVAVPNTRVSFDVNYSTEPAETPITEIAVRMHWDSSQVAFDPVTGLTNLFPFGAQPTGVVEDDPVTNGGLDGDPNTDKYILQAWIDAGGNWPNHSNPTLYTANFTALPGFEGTPINFSANPDNLPANSTFVPSSIALTPRIFTLDIDGNGVVDGLTDGILALRYLIEFRGETLTNNALGEGATRDASQIVTYLDEARDIMLDVDGNGTAGGLSDGILLLRYALGLRGDALISRAIEEGATRTTETAILDHLQSFDLL